MAEKKTLLKFYIKQEELIRLVLYKFRDVKSFCKILHISRTRFYQYTNPNTTHRIYATTKDHLIWKMADLLDSLDYLFCANNNRKNYEKCYRELNHLISSIVTSTYKLNK